MPYGVRIYNGRQITVVNEETEVFAVRDNFSTNDPSMPYIQDEFWGFQMQSSVMQLSVGGSGTANQAAYMKPVTAFVGRANEWTVVNMRRRSMASTSRLGASPAGGWGVRIWASNPRRLAFDSGHKIFQPRVYRALKYNDVIQINNGEWMFPIMVTGTDSVFSTPTLFRQSANTFRLLNWLNDPPDWPVSKVALTMFVMPNL
jgi:hypothetical protein